MNVARTAAEVLDEHATLELECVDRMYLNAYVPVLQTCGGAAWFFRKVRGKPVPSSALMAPMSRNFVASNACGRAENWPLEKLCSTVEMETAQER